MGKVCSATESLQGGMGEIGSTKESLQCREANEELALLKPFQLGPFKLAHRIVMAPLTRCRSYGGIPQPHAAIYYTQRATAGGLIISEGTGINETFGGYPHAPGIWTTEQVEAWKPIVKAVHDKGAIFFLQLWHVGRVSHTSFQPNGGKPVSPTNRAIKTGTLVTMDGTMQPYSQPRALETDEIAGFVNDFARCAKNAIAAGFDGVEVHGAHGYLLDQFLQVGVNDRTDKYGGSLENRARFVLDVVDAVADAIGADRVGIRLSPFASPTTIDDAIKSDHGPYMAEELWKRKILYVRWNVIHEQHGIPDHALWLSRNEFTHGPFLGTSGFTRDKGNAAVQDGKVDLVVYGRFFLANPDLVRRFELNAPLNECDYPTFYTQDPVVGYTDYPFLEQSHPEFAKAHEM